MQRVGLIVLLTLALLFGAAAHAQVQGSLIVWVNGDFWAWSPGADASVQTLFCTVDPQEEIVTPFRISPDGRYVTFNVWPVMVTDALERTGGIGGGELPSDILVCDLQTGALTRIAGQPENASFFQEGVPDNATMHGAASWSPDGTQLAWTEFGYPEVEMRLVVHTLAAGETRTIIPALPPQYGTPTNIEVQWGAPGLLYQSFEYDPTAQLPVSSIHVIDPATGAATYSLTVPEPAGGGDVFPIRFLWIDNAGVPSIGAQFNDGHWEVIDPATGEIARMPGLPELYSLTAPSGVSAVLEPRQTGDFWLAREGGAETAVDLDLQTDDPDGITISPDGAALAFFSEGSAYVYQGGTVSPVPNSQAVDTFTPNGLVWGPTAWRVWPFVSPGGLGLEPPILGQTTGGQGGGDPSTPAGMFTCPGSLPAVLAPGMAAVVTDIIPNRVRDAASTTANTIGQIPSGGVFRVLEGPVCADGYTWWRVDYDGLVGWTAQGDAQGYWIGPLS